MPMNAAIDRSLDFHHIGPTLKTIMGGDAKLGDNFYDHFEGRLVELTKIATYDAPFVDNVMKVNLLNGRAKRMKANVHRLPLEQGFLINFSLGVNAMRIIENLGLVANDFAPTDNSIDMIYMIEVQQALLQESRRLTKQLYNDRKSARENADSDPLTGLANRRGMDAFMRRIMNRKKFVSFALLNIDLDYFKKINDSYGHGAGDYVLRKVADRLRGLTRPSDMVARTGGDEFLIVLSDISDTKSINELATRVITELEIPIIYENISCNISASVGAAFIPQKTDIDQLITDTDALLYQSKLQGRGRVSFM